MNRKLVDTPPGRRFFTTSTQAYLSNALILVILSAIVIVNTFYGKREAIGGVVVLLILVWMFIFFLMSRFKLEILGDSIRYRKFFSFQEVPIQDVASFRSGDKRPFLMRNLAFEIKMKPGISPSEHTFNFRALSKEGQEYLLSVFQANSIGEDA